MKLKLTIARINRVIKLRDYAIADNNFVKVIQADCILGLLGARLIELTSPKNY